MGAATCVALLGLALSQADARSEPDADGSWSARQLRILDSLRLSSAGSPPRSPSNRVADDPIAAALGRELFHDRRLSAGGELSCASCHRAALHFTDGLPRSRGVGDTGRNAPTLVGAAWQSWFYWDGRRDSLWAQALVPFEAANEMGSSRTAIVRIVASDPALRARYEQVFGPLPQIPLNTLPPQAGPLGDATTQAAWFRIPRARRQRIDAIYVNLGKAVAAYERTLVPAPTRFDAYANAVLDDGAQRANAHMNPDETAGLALFVDDRRTRCLQCHNGPMLSNGGFHNVGTGTPSGEHIDLGRILGLQAVLMDEFNCLGPYSDADEDECLELKFLNRGHHIEFRGAFKTPTLRGLSHTAPYMHDGRFTTLEQVVAHYASPPGDREGEVPPHELRRLDLDGNELRQLAAFLRALDTATPRAANP